MAYYNNLAPGTYNLKVKVANSDGIWNPKEATLRITVMPPLYKTWWAYALYFIVITTIIWKFIYYQKVRHELESNIRFKQMEQEKMKELHEGTYEIIYQLLTRTMSFFVDNTDSLISTLPFWAGGKFKGIG